jgi:hypothetical protein
MHMIDERRRCLGEFIHGVRIRRHGRRRRRAD